MVPEPAEPWCLRWPLSSRFMVTSTSAGSRPWLGHELGTRIFVLEGEIVEVEVLFALTRVLLRELEIDLLHSHERLCACTENIVLGPRLPTKDG